MAIKAKEEDNLKNMSREEEITIKSIKYGVLLAVVIVALFVTCFTSAPPEKKNFVITIFIYICLIMIFGPIIYGIFKKIISKSL